MTIKMPFCFVDFISELPLEEVASKISEQMFGGLPFGPRRNWIDECITVRLASDVLGCAVYLIQSPENLTHFSFQVENQTYFGDSPVTEEELAAAFPSLTSTNKEPYSEPANISDFVGLLLKRIGFRIGKPDSDQLDPGR
jgi:hypothetical protein